MVAKKRTPKKAAKKTPAKDAKKGTKRAAMRPEENIDASTEDELEFVDDQVSLATTIESRVVIDAIEHQHEEERRTGGQTYRVMFHADLPEHVVQHLFSHHVQDGGINIEFQPADPKLKRRDTLVRR